MTILFVGSEPGDFDYCGATFTTTAGRFRSGYSRGAMYGYSGEAITLSLPTAPTEVWLSGRHWLANGVQSPNADVTLIDFAGSGGVRWRVTQTDYTTTSAFLKLMYRNSSGTFVTAASVQSPYPFGNGVICSVAAYLKVHATLGEIRLYVDGQLKVSYTGDTTVGGLLSAVTSASLFCCYSSGGATGARAWSEVVAADEDIRNIGVMRLTPTGAGATSAWTGTFAEIDDTDVNDADNISSATADQESQFVLSDLTGAGTIHSVVVKARAAKGSTGPQNLQIGARVGSTNYLSGNLNPTTQYGPVQYSMAVNPATGAAWTVTDINSMQLAVKSIA